MTAGNRRADTDAREVLRRALQEPLHGVAKKRAAARRRVTGAMTPLLGEKKAKDIAFHLFDWIEDAEFVTALAIAPRSFARSEIQERLAALLAHAPNHLAAAAALWGDPVSDVFGVWPKTRGRASNNALHRTRAARLRSRKKAK